MKLLNHQVVWTLGQTCGNIAMHNIVILHVFQDCDDIATTLEKCYIRTLMLGECSGTIVSLLQNCTFFDIATAPWQHWANIVWVLWADQSTMLPHCMDVAEIHDFQHSNNLTTALGEHIENQWSSLLFSLTENNSTF